MLVNIRPSVVIAKLSPAEVAKVGMLNDFRKFESRIFLSFSFSIYKNRISFPKQLCAVVLFYTTTLLEEILKSATFLHKQQFAACMLTPMYRAEITRRFRYC